MQKRVLVLGGLEEWLIVYVANFPDARPQTVFADGYHETIGGTGFGKAVSLSRLGIDVQFHSTVGDDDRGKRMRAALTKELHFVCDIDPAGTRRQIHVINDAGERLSYFINHGSLNPVLELNTIEALIIASDIVVVNTINYTKALLPLIRQHRKIIWCDIHDYHRTKTYYDEFVQVADCIQFSSYWMPQYREFMAELINQGKQLVVCTHADKGATAVTAEGKWVDEPAIDSYVRTDPNGAGDSFCAGILFALANGYPIELAVRCGIIVGGLSVTTREPCYPMLSVELLRNEYREYYGSDLFRSEGGA
ncbi:MAG: carbohydrate kinase family protein [Thermoanaerobaculia bacterium]